MCYSAVIYQDYRYFVRRFGAVVDIHEFVRLFWTRRGNPKTLIPKAMEVAFSSPANEDEAKIKSLADEFAAAQSLELEQELFKQVKRLADAERTLQVKTTKAALESQRIATKKVEQIKGWLADLRRTSVEERDSRIFPQHYAPVMVMEDGRYVVKPMRYGCLPAGKPAFYDVKFPGTYNARRDNLEGFWKQQFGRSHGVTVATAFYENVNLHRREGRELQEGEGIENVIVEFKPRPTQDMLIACLWSRWIGPDGTELLSFAAITDEPPPEVQAAGHDRCIIPLKPENVDAWLNPDAKNLAATYAILDDRERPFYEHRMAA
jgi:putative SOS response-associated peptidase YedK